MISPTDYSRMVKTLCKTGETLASNVTPHQMEVIHHAIGISGEAGELLDAAKKYFIYNKPIDRENVIEELGDLEFYMDGLRQTLKISREETIQANWNKLSKRYPQGYSDKAAQERLDKQ